jgi:choline-sulfatase
MSDRPNILFIFTDQQSASMMSCAGNEYLKTPAMDSLAENGMRFERAYCSDPVCCPSRFSLMTGRMPSEVGLRANGPVGVETIPRHILDTGAGHVLRSAGYETAYGGKVHLPKMSVEDIGFDCISEDQRDGLADKCVDFIQKDHDKPFFLVASFINPHDICYMAIRDYAESDQSKRLMKHASKEIAALDEALQTPEGLSEEEFFETVCPPLPENHHPQENEPEAIDFLMEQRNFRGHARDNYDEKTWRLHRWAYCRLTERVDAQIGRVLKSLRDSGKDKDTVVIFSSDHGDHDSSHKMEHKTAFYEEAVAIPLIISQPGVTPKAVCSEVVSNGLDLLPTICDYAGAEVPDGLLGTSLRPLAEGAAAPERRYIPVEGEVGRMIVTDDFKYKVYDDGEHREQLIDLKNDPGETRNAATDPHLSAVLEDHRKHFAEHFGSDASLQFGALWKQP